MTIVPTAKLRVLDDHLVVQTQWVHSARNGAYAEIHLSPEPEQPGRQSWRHDCRRCTVLLTREARLAQRAEASYGTLHRFTAQWAPGTQPDGSKCQVLLGLEAK